MMTFTKSRRFWPRVFVVFVFSAAACGCFGDHPAVTGNPQEVLTCLAPYDMPRGL